MNLSYSNTIRLLNRLLNNSTFLRELAEYSNKDYYELLSNLSNIIIYYLHTKDQNTYSIQELINKTKNIDINNSEYLLIPSNQVYKHHLFIHGLNGKRSDLDDLLIELSSDIVFNSYPSNLYYSNIYDNPTAAVTSSLEYPDILFNGILKRPFNNDEINPEESEKTYYESILSKKLPFDSDAESSRCIKTSKRVMNIFIPNKPMLVVIPTKSIINRLQEEELSKNEIYTHIPARFLSFINLPSKYELLKLCYTKKDKKQKETEEASYSYGYNRFESITIDENFIYTGPKLTGDPSYDIDIIYGKATSPDKRFDKTTPFLDNLSKIKRSQDINLVRMDGYYKIENGRHRLLYLLNYYLDYTKGKISKIDLEYIKKMLTITANVRCHIEDQEFNNIIKLLTKKYRVYIYKNELRNDEPNIYISLNNVVYHTKSTEELKDLYDLLNNNINNNKYFVGEEIERENDHNRYNKLFNSLISHYQERITKMSFEDILKIIGRQDINYRVLYNEYRILMNSVTYTEASGIQTGYIKRATQEHIKDRLYTYLVCNPEILDNEIKDIYIILQMNFGQYDIDTIKSCLKISDITGLQELNSINNSNKK